MPIDDDNKRAAQQDLLRELRDLQNVLSIEPEQVIPVLNDVVETAPGNESPHKASSEKAGSGPRKSAASDIALADTSHYAEPAVDTVQRPAYEQDRDLLQNAEPVKPSPFALVNSRSLDYDTSTAESLVEEGLVEALQALTQEMDDEALRLLDELVAEHADIIRKELVTRLNEKSSELRAQLAASQTGNA